MQYKPKILALLLALTFINTPVLAYVAKDFATQRALFIQVEADLKKGKMNSYRKHRQALVNYPLYSYLKYHLLRTNIKEVKHSEISAFIKTYPDSPLVNKLRNEWLKAKADRKQWSEFLLAYDPEAKNDLEMQCHYIYANVEVKDNKEVYNLVPDLWLSSKSLPKACDKVVDAWIKEGHLTRDLVWQRIKLSINENNNQLARHLSKNLSKNDQAMVELWIRTNHDPHIVSKPHYFSAKHPAINEIIIHGLKKIAKTKPKDAVKLWHELSVKHAFSEFHWGSVVREIGLALSRKFDAHADKWLSTVPDSLRTKEVNDARLKLAVHNNSWQVIASVYKTLPQEEQLSDKWQYWHARSLEMLGDRETSQAALIKLAQMRNYYGFLASARVLKPYSFNQEAKEIPKEVMDIVTQKPALIRAYELKQIDRVHTGRTEWYKALEGMDDQQRLAAAQLASEWGVPNWAIVALANASNKNDLVLRFPQTYADYIHKEARHNDIDPAILFAITRQESAFIPTAKSPVGALGLMQIMPKTGKMLARVSRESLRSHQDLLKPEKNIRLGSKYVRMMLDQYQQNPALAAAAYNAGPHRVAAWLPEYDMPADSWIETIAFKETREYVQNVLAYAVIYKQLLGKTPKLNNYMPIINGKKRTAKK
jgi:soluble lytic murein transglycosylase